MKVRNGFVSNSSSSSFVISYIPKYDTSDKIEEKLQEMLRKHGKNYIFEDVFDPVVKGSKEYDQELEEWGYLRYVDDYTTVGKKVITSRSDNSIPWELCEEIEKEFQCDRLHLG